ncbi:MAG: phosphopyruvate hydratase [Acidobacteria bacterium]|nr:phosphopyruvate hydratase [Acidobacteriota bacterium]
MGVTVRRLRALEILDSRGNPTLAVTIELSNGVAATAHVPSGASTGTHEALELRDGDRARYGGRGVRRAVGNVEGELSRALAGASLDDHRALDRRMIELDGTPGKSRLGANAILGVSCAAARALASCRGLPLWQSLSEAFPGERPTIPVPMVNILSGGLHAAGNIEFQDFLVIAHGFESLSQALEATVSVHRAARQMLDDRGFAVTGVADEGGWGPRLPRNETALEILTAAIARAGYQAGEHFSIAVDVAASHFHDAGRYRLRTEGRDLSASEMIDLLEHWCDRYPVRSIEDGLEEDDWQGWAELTRRLGARVQLVGDDLLATNPARLRTAIGRGAANAVLVKMNQIGTLSETFEVIELASASGYRPVISARSGETEDSFLADLAVASGAGQIKIGSLTRSERLAKYNRLLEIEARHGLPYGGRGWR